MQRPWTCAECECMRQTCSRAASLPSFGPRVCTHRTGTTPTVILRSHHTQPLLARCPHTHTHARTHRMRVQNLQFSGQSSQFMRAELALHVSRTCACTAMDMRRTRVRAANVFACSIAAILWTVRVHSPHRRHPDCAVALTPHATAARTLRAHTHTRTYTQDARPELAVQCAELAAHASRTCTSCEQDLCMQRPWTCAECECMQQTCSRAAPPPSFGPHAYAHRTGTTSAVLSRSHYTPR